MGPRGPGTKSLTGSSTRREGREYRAGRERRAPRVLRTLFTPLPLPNHCPWLGSIACTSREGRTRRLRAVSRSPGPAQKECSRRPTEGADTHRLGTIRPRLVPGQGEPLASRLEKSRQEWADVAGPPQPPKPPPAWALPGPLLWSLARARSVSTVTRRACETPNQGPCSSRSLSPVVTRLPPAAEVHLQYQAGPKVWG